ncbi:hypothetical protein V6N13_148116 [Hibiscus sabdariffa]|uniref:Uncharacterized protein n=1 Tax=Hibiscus sabdariffa TaxID=183260 RepID=A0ABR2TXX3_9ROSI
MNYEQEIRGREEQGEGLSCLGGAGGGCQKIVKRKKENGRKNMKNEKIAIWAQCSCNLDPYTPYIAVTYMDRSFPDEISL